MQHYHPSHEDKGWKLVTVAWKTNLPGQVVVSQDYSVQSAFYSLSLKHYKQTTINNKNTQFSEYIGS